MEFADLIIEMLGVSPDFYIEKLEKRDDPAEIKIRLKYKQNKCKIGLDSFYIYDYAPVREWQHLS